MEKTPLLDQKNDADFESFKHEPELLLGASTPAASKRRERSAARMRYFTPSISIVGAVSALFGGPLFTSTVFSSQRLMSVVATHISLSFTLAIIYYFLPINDSVATDFTSGIKDFVDLSVTGIVFLLGGFVTTMLTRWWAFRTQCVGGLHQSLTNLAMYAGTLWPSASPVDREARALVNRYSLLAYQLLFVEARAADLFEEKGVGPETKLRQLVESGTLTPEEAAVLEPLPSKSGAVIGWLTAFWEAVLDKESPLACAAAITPAKHTANNGRFGAVFGQIFAARNSISLCHMYMQTQLPYGYIHLILIIVQITCVANSLFCGIHLGQVIQEATTPTDGVAIETHDTAQVLIPLMIVRFMRICFIPLLLDGMLLVGNVIAMPLGEDDDDFPAGEFLETLEDDALTAGAANELFPPRFSPLGSLTQKAKADAPLA